METSGRSRADRHGQTVAADGRRVDPRAVRFDGEIVHQKAGLKVVRAVEDEIGRGKKLFHIVRAEIGDNSENSDIAVDGAELSLGSDGFGKRGAGVLLVEQSLALEVGRLDEVAIDDGDLANSGPDKKVGCGGPNRAATDNGNARSEQTTLTFLAEAVKEDLPGIPLCE